MNRDYFISSFVCDNLMYKILDSEISDETKSSIIKIINLILTSRALNSENVDFLLIISLLNEQLSLYKKGGENLSIQKRLSISTVTLSFINFLQANVSYEYTRLKNELERLESKAYNILEG